MSEREIRSFEARDRDELRQLFPRAGEGSPTASLWGHEESEVDVYLTPYMDLEPESLFVARVDGNLVGYLAGCVDSSRIASESDRMAAAIKGHRLVLHPGAVWFFMRSTKDMTGAAIRRKPTVVDFEDDRWPAHLHINVVPEVRGTGVAVDLMNRWFERLAAVGSPGCHLQTLVENTRAVQFFTRMGFVEHGPTPRVPGIRYQRQPVHQQTMVWTPASG